MLPERSLANTIRRRSADTAASESRPTLASSVIRCGVPNAPLTVERRATYRSRLPLRSESKYTLNASAAKLTLPSCELVLSSPTATGLVHVPVGDERVVE